MLGLRRAVSLRGAVPGVPAKGVGSEESSGPETDDWSEEGCDPEMDGRPAEDGGPEETLGDIRRGCRVRILPTATEVPHASDPPLHLSTGPAETASHACPGTSSGSGRVWAWKARGRRRARLWIRNPGECPDKGGELLTDFQGARQTSTYSRYN